MLHPTPPEEYPDESVPDEADPDESDPDSEPSPELIEAIGKAETLEELRELLRQIDPKILAECGVV